MPKLLYVVKVADAKGNFGPRQHTNLPDGKGISDGIVATVDPYAGVGELTFSGRPHVLNLEKAEVLQAFVDTGRGLKSVFFGALRSGARGELGLGLKPYTASARALFVATSCRGERYKKQDTAAIALDLAIKHKHAALKVKAADFPASGTVLDEFTALGRLGEVLDNLLELTEDASYGSGLSADGYVFFRPNRLTRTVSFAATNHRDLPVSGEAISTATAWHLAAEPTIAPWGGAYLPRPFIHVSVPEPDLHAQYGYETSREIPLGALSRITGSAYTGSGFTTPENAGDEDETTAAVRSGATATLTLSNADPLVVGVRIVYRTTEGAGAVRLRASCGVLYDVELPDTKGETQPLDLKLPPHEGAFAYWSSFRLTSLAGGTAEVFSFLPLAVDTDRLDALAVVVIPEQRPVQIVEDGIQEVPAFVELTGGLRGTVTLPVAAVRYTVNDLDPPSTVTDLGVNADEAEAQGLQKVSGYYRRPRK